MRSHGLSAVTTRQISKEVGCSDGALYAHFKGRLELLLAMLEESLPDMRGAMRTLKESVGQGDAQANLVAAIKGMYVFHHHAVPQVSGLFAEPQLLIAYRNSLNRQNRGPHLAMKTLEDYIRAEQDLGRIAPHIDAKLSAYLLMSSSFFRAFVEHFTGKPMHPGWSKFAKQLTATVAPQP